MIELDGTQGEGGGQILRGALALAMCTGQSFRLNNVRGNRPKPGLMRQHLTAVRAAAAICDGVVDGAALGSRSVSVVPGAVRAGAYEFDIGSAGSTMMVLQAILPALALAPAASTVVIRGGTHNPMAPTFEFVAATLVPQLAKLGWLVEVTLDRPGFMPAGGGQLTVRIAPARGLHRYACLQRGAWEGADVHVLLCNLRRDIATREALALQQALPELPGLAHRISQQRGKTGAGSALALALRYAHVVEVVTSLGAPGKPAEAVAREVAAQAKAYLRTKAPIGEHLCDQLLVPLAVTAGGVFRACKWSTHAQSQAALLAKFGKAVTMAYDEVGVCVEVG